MGEDILHLYPVKDRHRRLRPHPVHAGAQLEQERDQHESLEEEHVDVAISLTQEVPKDPRGIAATNLIGRQ